MRRPIKYIFFLLLLAVVVSAQPPQISIVDFKGGLVTNHSRFSLKSNQALECRNWDLSAKIGALVKRKGYVSIFDTVLHNQPDSEMVGIYGYTSRSGVRRLMAVMSLDSSATGSGDYTSPSNMIGLAQIRITDDYEYELLLDNGATALLPDSVTNPFRYIYGGQTPWFVTFRDMVIISNGHQTPFAYGSDNWLRDLKPPTPGGVTITPMNRANSVASSPNGEYLYVVGYRSDCGVYWPSADEYGQGVVSNSIRLKNEMALITGWPRHAIDSACAIAVEADSNLDISLYRTRANPGNFDIADTLWEIFEVVDQDFDYLDTLWIIDSIPDTAFGSSITEFLLPDLGFIAFDSNKADANQNRPGAPTFQNTNTAIPMIIPDTGSTVSSSVINWDSVNYVGFAYAMTFRDTLTQIESDTGRSLLVYFNVGDSAFEIGLPPLPTGMNHLERILYRADIHATDAAGGDIIGYDSTAVEKITRYWSDGRKDTHPPPGKGFNPFEGEDIPDRVIDSTRIDTVWIVRRVNAVDTSVGAFLQTAIIPDAATIFYLDSTLWANIPLQDIYIPTLDINNLKGVTTFDDRLFGYDRSFVYWSDFGDISGWVDFLSINLDDGDEITALVPFRSHIKVYKNKSQYVIVPFGNGYARDWTVQGVGCIAPRSMVNYRNGLVYLSGNGVIHEKGSLFLSKGASFDTISTAINNLFQYKASDLADARGVIKNDKYMLSFPDKDTTYVFDFVVGAWSIWDYAFEDVTFYDTVNTGSMTPSNDMLFIDGETEYIFKADTTYLDNGSQIGFSWKSGALTRNADEHSISKYGLWAKGEGVGPAEFMRFEIIDVRDSVVDTNLIRLVTDTSLYHIYNVRPHKSNSFSFKMKDHSALKPDTLIIWGIDFWVKMKGKKIIE